MFAIVTATILQALSYQAVGAIGDKFFTVHLCANQGSVMAIVKDGLVPAIAVTVLFTSAGIAK